MVSIWELSSGSISVRLDSTENTMSTESSTGHAGCSYIEQYSQIPETSAFQRHQNAQLHPSKATATEKENNSEQYDRNFTTYDGITSRDRKQGSSVPRKREDNSNKAAERVHKMRHKLNPVRDYKLMDTVHYLAQGEFAPRDDGVKLTQSREAVLSDIIWEDVCRTHWPNARLGRRVAERHSTRCELQRLIDSLLRERVAHVERRRRRHYRVVKMNHRQEKCRPFGKTGDIIVASHRNHKNGESFGENDVAINARQLKEAWRGTPRSHDHFTVPEMTNRSRYEEDDDVAGPSYAIPRSSAATCCYHALNCIKTYKDINAQALIRDLTSSSHLSICNQMKKPSLVAKKDISCRRNSSKEKPNLEHYIFLPSLVERTPSNLKRQRKFNELYHRILKIQTNNDSSEPGPSLTKSFKEK